MTATVTATVTAPAIPVKSEPARTVRGYPMAEETSTVDQEIRDRIKKAHDTGVRPPCGYF